MSDDLKPVKTEKVGWGGLAWVIVAVVLGLLAVAAVVILWLT